jgi:hypothetical protein
MWAVVMSSPNFIGDSAIQLRRRLPQRRFHELLDFEHAGCRYTAGLGFFETGGLAEIFINVPGRSGSAIEAVARDAAILTSICLQYGASLETIRHGLTRKAMEVRVDLSVLSWICLLQLQIDRKIDLVFGSIVLRKHSN